LAGGLSGLEWVLEADFEPDSPVSAAARAVRVMEVWQGRVSEAILEFRRMGTQAMQLVLRPDGETEVRLQFQLRDGRVDVQAQLQRGEFQQVTAHWAQLQQLLAQQGVRLGELEPQPGRPQTSAESEQFQSPEREPPPREAGGSEMLGRPSRLGSAGRAVINHQPTGAVLNRSWETWA